MTKHNKITKNVSNIKIKPKCNNTNEFKILTETRIVFL